ncbi:MAG: hypothetical protein U0X20_09475 [Caldilineaceae bacterium]
MPTFISATNNTTIRNGFNDFGRAFYAVIDEAIGRKVDFVILAGDLFHKRSIDALTLNQAIRGLEKAAPRRHPLHRRRGQP